MGAWRASLWCVDGSSRIGARARPAPEGSRPRCCIMSAPTTISDIRLLVVYHHGVEFLTAALEAALESARVARRSQGRLSIGISVMLNGISSQTHAAAASIAS